MHATASRRQSYEQHLSNVDSPRTTCRSRLSGRCASIVLEALPMEPWGNICERAGVILPVDTEYATAESARVAPSSVNCLECPSLNPSRQGSEPVVASMRQPRWLVGFWHTGSFSSAALGSACRTRRTVATHHSEKNVPIATRRQLSP